MALLVMADMVARVSGYNRREVNGTSLFLGLIFSCIGTGFLIYGRKQVKPVPLVCGLLLIIVTFVISDTTVLVIAGVVLTAIPYFVRL